MPDPTFDPDKYLAETPSNQSQEQGFDPDAYLSAPQKKSPVTSSSQGGSQGLQDGPKLPSGGIQVPEQPLAGLGGVEQPKSNLEIIGQTIERGPKEDIGEYIIDGKPVREAEAKRMAYDRAFIDRIAKGAGRDVIDIRGDDAMVELFRRQVESKKTNDTFDSLMLSIARGGQMVAGAVDYVNDLTSELTGIPNALYTVVGASAGPSGAAKGATGGVKEKVSQAIEKFQEDAKFAEEQRFQVEGDFIDQVGKAWDTGSLSDIGEVVNTAINKTAESAVPSLMIALGTAATGGGTGMLALARGGLAVTPAFIGGEYAEQQAQMKDIKKRFDESQRFLSASEVPTEDELALMNLSRTNQLLRPALRGSAEMAGEVVTAGILKGTTKLATQSMKSLISKTAASVGKDAAEEVAKQSAKELSKRILTSIGVEPLKEGFAELGTYAAQELTDVLMGVSTKSPARILREGANAWALGAVSGGMMATPGTAATGIVLGAKGLSNAKKYLDNILAFDPQGLESLNEAVRNMEESGRETEAEQIKTNLEKREKAVKAVPTDMVSDTEAVDMAQEVQELEETKKGLLPVFQAPIEAKIEELNGKLAGKASSPSEAAKTEVEKATESLQQEKASIEQKMKEEIAEARDPFNYGPPLPFPNDLARTPNNEKRWLDQQKAVREKQMNEAEAAIREKYAPQLQDIDEKISESNKQTQAEPVKEVAEEAVAEPESSKIDKENLRLFEEKKRKADKAVAAKEDEVKVLESEKKAALSESGPKAVTGGDGDYIKGSPSDDGTFFSSMSYPSERGVAASTFFQLVKRSDGKYEAVIVEENKKRLANTNNNANRELYNGYDPYRPYDYTVVRPPIYSKDSNGDYRLEKKGLISYGETAPSEYDSKIDKAKQELTELKKQRDAVQEPIPTQGAVRQQPEARQGVREGDTQGQEAPREGQAEAAQEEVTEGEVAAPATLSESYRQTPVSEITTDEARFQNRESLDEARVDEIVKNFDERKLDPIVTWTDPETGNAIVLSGHHRFAAAQKLGLKTIPARDFKGTEAEAIEFARDSNTLGKQETPIERAARYKSLRDEGVKESELKSRARAAHGKDSAFILNLSRLSPDGKPMDAIRQFMESGDRAMRTKMEAIGDWIGATIAMHPDISKAQEAEMFEYLLERYSPKKARGLMSSRNQFTDVANHLIEKLKERGTFNENSVLNFENRAGKGSAEMEFDAALDEAIANEKAARKTLDDKRAEFMSRGATQGQLDKALQPYEKAIRDAMKEVSEIRGQRERAIQTDRNQILLFDEIIDLPIAREDADTEQQIEELLAPKRAEKPKAERSDRQGQAAPKKSDTQKALDEAKAERARRRKEIEAEIAKDQGDIWNDLNTLGFAATPKRTAEETRKLQEQLLRIAKNYIERNILDVQDFIDAVVENYKGKWNDIASLAEAAFNQAISEQTAAKTAEQGLQEKPEVPKPKKGESVKRYTTRVVNDLKGLADKKVLEDALRTTGLTRATVSWKEVQPIALEIVDDIFSDPKKVNEKMDALYNTILGTSTGKYIDNPKLSTLHSLIFHAAIDRMKNEGMDADYLKWVTAFQAIGESNGRFTSAMQRDSSPYAVRNLVIRPLLQGDTVKLAEETETGSTRKEEVAKVKELLDQLMQDEKLMELYEKRINELEKQLEKASQEQFYANAPRTQEAAPKVKGKERVKAGRKMFLEGLRESRGQFSAGLPVNEKILNGIKEMVIGLIEEGMYEASRIKKAVMKDVNSALKDDSDSIIQVAEAIDAYLASSEFDESRKTAMKQAFVEALENRAKAMMGNRRAAEKSAEQVLLDSLLTKIGSDMGPNAKPGSRAYQQRIAEAIENMEFSDDVWKSAIANVSAWIASQDIDPASKAEILARLEDTASSFMQKPYAKSDMRKAIREGEKELGVSIAEVVKRHFSEQNRTLQTLAEKLVSDLGLSAEAAKRYEQAVIEEARSYMDDKRMSAIRKALDLDKAGRKKDRSDSVNKRIIDRMIEGINLGMLDDDTFRSMFSEKYGLVDLTPEMARSIQRFNDLIHLHEGTDVAKAYTKQLADYIETLKPWNAAAVAQVFQSLTIKGMLNGISTFLNISAGSVYSFLAGAGPSALANPVATAAFFKEYSKAGLSGTSRRMFVDIMRDGRSPIDEGLGGKYEEGEIYGDRFEHFVREYDSTKLREMASAAKTPKEVGFVALVAAARAHAIMGQVSNFAKAFDVLLSNRGVEFEMFLKEYNELSKEAGHPLRGRFDPSVSKKFMERLREKMAYDPEIKAEIEASVDEQIAGMKARGERVGFGTRSTLIREGVIARRNLTEYRQAQERVRSFLLMEDPTGVLGALYDIQRGAGSIKGDESAGKAMLKLGYSLTFGLFLRISITATQRSIENIPVAGLLMPGVFYDKASKDPLNPKSKKEWMTFMDKTYDRQLMKRRIATHALIAGLTAAAAWNMFLLKDDEEEEEQKDGSFRVVKKKRIELNPDRIIELTGYSGQFFEAEQYSQGGDERKDFYFRAKVNGKWENIAPIRLNPNFLFSSAVLGGMADEIKLKPNEETRKRELILKSADDFMLALSEFSFASNAKLIRKTFYAAEREGLPGAAAEIGEFVLRPARVAIYPNALRDTYKEIRALQGSEEKMGTGVLGALTNDAPVMEDMIGQSTYDIFGNPKKVTSKFVQVASDIPAVGIVVNNLIDYKNRNQERFESVAWQRKMEYFPFVKIEGYWPRGFERSTQVEASRIYGEKMREWVESKPESFFSEKTPAQIDNVINGALKPDGSRMNDGVHDRIMKEVASEMKFSNLENLKKRETGLRSAVRSLQSQSPVDTEEMNATLKSLEETVRNRKALEEKLKPKK